MRAELRRGARRGPARVAEGHEILAQELDAHGRTVGLGSSAREQAGIQYRRICGAHRRAGADACDELVLFVCRGIGRPPR